MVQRSAGSLLADEQPQWLTRTATNASQTASSAGTLASRGGDILTIGRSDSVMQADAQLGRSLRSTGSSSSRRGRLLEQKRGLAPTRRNVGLVVQEGESPNIGGRSGASSTGRSGRGRVRAAVESVRDTAASGEIDQVPNTNAGVQEVSQQ